MSTPLRGHLCEQIGLAPPSAEYECMEAINTQGRACRRCHREDCYRQGWSADVVTADNRRLVTAKQNQPKRKG